MSNKFNHMIYISIIVLLSGCMGGSPSTTPSPTPSLVYSSKQSNTSPYSGTNISSVGAADQSTSATKQITAITLNGSGDITKLTLTSSDGVPVTYEASNGDVIYKYESGGETIIAAYNSTKTSAIALLIGDESFMVNNYNTSGGTFYNTSSYSGNASSVDPSTVISSATYTGYLMGTKLQSGQLPVLTVARVSLLANFLNKSIGLSTSEMYGVGGAAIPSMELSGTLTDPDGNNNYTGIVSDVAGATGTSEATLMGSTVSEVAGTGSVTNGTYTHTYSVWAER